MPFATINGIKCHYQFDDFGKNEVLVFSNSLGCDLSIWQEQVNVLRPHFKILRYDTRGHGQSGIGVQVPTMADLGSDVLALLLELGMEDPVYFCGLSMGGLIGQWLGINAPDRFEKIILSNTAAKIGDAQRWNQRMEKVRQEGMVSIRESTEDIWFGEKFKKNSPDQVAQMLARLVKTKVEGYTNCCAAIRDADFCDQLQGLKVPTLVISGDKDRVTTTEDAIFMTGRIPISHHVSLPAAHLANVEQPDAFSKSILSFTGY